MMDIVGALEGNDRGRNKQNILNWGVPKSGNWRKYMYPKEREVVFA